jgi:hypothetical protein
MQWNKQTVDIIGLTYNGYKGEKKIKQKFDQNLNLTLKDVENIVISPQFDRVVAALEESKATGANISWVVLANVATIANKISGDKARFGVGLSGGYASSEDQFIFCTWEKLSISKELFFEPPVIQRWIRSIISLAEQFLPEEPTDEKNWFKELSRLKSNKASKADCIECRVQSVGTLYTLLCHGLQKPKPSLPYIVYEDYWEEWDLNDHATQCGWILARSMQNYIYTGRPIDSEIRNFIVCQSAARTGKSVFMDALARLTKSMGLTLGNLPNSNVFSRLEFASAGIALIDDEDKSEGKDRGVSVLFTSAVVKSLVSGSEAPYSMKNSSATVPVKNKILLIQNTNHVNLADIVNADAGNLDRLRLLHINRATLNKWFEMWTVRFDPNDIPGSYDRLVHSMLWSKLLPLEPERWCRFDPLRYDLGSLLHSIVAKDPGMVINSALYWLLDRHPEHYRIQPGGEHSSIHASLHPTNGDQKVKIENVLPLLAGLLATDPEYPNGQLKQKHASTWYALFSAAVKLVQQNKVSVSDVAKSVPDDVSCLQLTIPTIE